ncbi:MAG: L,D-transpeptidase family protein [Bacillota bacterium]|jgi:hypothetical protein
MLRKLTIVLMALVLVAVSSCAFFKNAPSPQGNKPIPEPNLPKEDKLPKSDKEGVEENINGIDINSDKRITQSSYDEEDKRILSLSQPEQKKLLENITYNNKNAVLHEYNTVLPVGVNNKVQYYEHVISYDYFLVTAENGADIRESPAPDAPVVCRVNNSDKITLLQRTDGVAVQGSNIWYRVACSHENKTDQGYIHSAAGTPRSFRFDKMLAAVNLLKQELAQGPLNYIQNYKNQNGAPPQKGEASLDEHGYRFYHSAPAYVQADTGSSFRYIPDGMLVHILNESGDFYYVNVPTFAGNFYVPKKYIDPAVTLSQLNQVVVVDRGQQNQAAFAVTENGLDLISYTLATTGIKGDYSFETTLGSFKAIEKKDRFEYLQKGTEKIGGYAPFAIRFTGGAYIHGVPVAYEEQNGERVDPGTTEFLQTIGTTPRSNMCVRNYTSHAKFLYDWMDTKNGAVIVIE